MLYLITGENTYRVEQEVRRILRGFVGEVTHVDGSSLTTNNLADIMLGNSLFATTRCVIVKHLSDNKLVWDKFGDWVSKVGDATTIVLIEPKPDKRTKTYKQLAKAVQLISAEQWTDRDVRDAEEWLRKIAHDSQVKLSPTQVHNMVERSMYQADKPGRAVIDQMRLFTALQSLSNLDLITDDAIATVLPNSPGDNILDLLALAINHQPERVRAMLSDLRLSENPHMVFSLIASQWAQLVSIAVAGNERATVAADLGIHPFVAQRLKALVPQISQHDIKSFTKLCAETDAGMKLSKFDPWDGIERFIFGIALRD